MPNQEVLPIPPGIGKDIDAELTAPLELPAEPGKPLTTQGGNTLDDGSGNTALGVIALRTPPSQVGNVASVQTGTQYPDLLLTSSGVSWVYLLPGYPGGRYTAGAPVTGWIVTPDMVFYRNSSAGIVFQCDTSGNVTCGGHINPNPTTPALPANPPVSGTVYQNTTGGPIIITVPITATAIGGSGQWALGATNTPGNWGGAEEIGVAGEVHNMMLYVPNDWYWSLTVASATIGTASVLGL